MAQAMHRGGGLGTGRPGGALVKVAARVHSASSK
jgi:hypothetical protein